MSSPREFLRRVAALSRGASARRLTALVALALGGALLTVEYVRVPSDDVKVGKIAERTIRASTDFPFTDWAATLERQRDAESDVLPVFDFDATLVGRVQGRVTDAVDVSRQRYTEARLSAGTAGREGPSDDELSEINRDFIAILGLSLDPADLERIAAMGWEEQITVQANVLVGAILRRTIIVDRSLLPNPPRSVTVVRSLRDRRDELVLDNYDKILTPDGARKELRLIAFDQDGVELSTDVQRAAMAIARAAVRPNFAYNQLITEDRRRAARDAVSRADLQVQRGTVLVREGDPVTQTQVEMLRAYRETHGTYSLGALVLSLAAFFGLVTFALYQFASGFIRKFSTAPRDLEAGAFLLLIVLAFSRLMTELAEPVSTATGLGLSTSSVWYIVPFAGGAMLMRILVNSETALIWVVGASVATGLLMDGDVLYTAFFAVSGLVAAGGIAHTKERVNVLRAGLITGLVNAAAALLINLVRAHLGDGPPASTGLAQPLWDMGFAFVGGNLAAIMVLGLVPMFEIFGFVTDYKLLELANLNHPLLRQLMLRAPGTYHHSVIVGSLAEAAAESIGCNALMTRVSCYFHDIGKAVKPQYFIENIRDAPNPHDRLSPHQSARIIVNHMLDGAAIARQYKLPKPIVDGILMHHGTGLIQYFYAKAVEEAGPDAVIDDSDFRYPGLLPDSRETGIIFLADRVEAACRTLKDPTDESIRGMIQMLVNTAVVDGQLEVCPLTIKELYTIVETFTNTLLGIYHHRIEYPGLPVRPPQNSGVPKSAIITLDVANPIKADEESPQAGKFPEA